MLDLISISEAAKRLKVSRSYLAGLVRYGNVPYVTVNGQPKIMMTAMLEWIRANPESGLANYTDRDGMTVNEIADWIGVSPRTVYRWRRQGMPAHGAPRRKRTRPAEFINWARKSPHVWAQVNI